MYKKATLMTFLSEVKAPCHRQGQRYKSVAIQLIIIMSALRNKFRYRETGRFCKNNEQTLLKLFKFKNGKAPSHATIRSFIKDIDFNLLQTAFHKWTKQYVPIEEDEWISIDGKSTGSTVSDDSSRYQNIVSPVSLFCRKREQILMVEKIETKKVPKLMRWIICLICLI